MDNLKTFEAFEGENPVDKEANEYLYQILEGQIKAELDDKDINNLKMEDPQGSHEEVDDFGWNFYSEDGGKNMAIYLNFNFDWKEIGGTSIPSSDPLGTPGEYEGNATLTDIEIEDARFYPDAEASEEEFELNDENRYLATKWLADNLPVDDWDKGVGDYIKRLKERAGVQ